MNIYRVSYSYIVDVDSNKIDTVQKHFTNKSIALGEYYYLKQQLESKMFGEGAYILAIHIIDCNKVEEMGASIESFPVKEPIKRNSNINHIKEI